MPCSKCEVCKIYGSCAGKWLAKCAAPQPLTLHTAFPVSFRPAKMTIKYGGQPMAFNLQFGVEV
jgi:hypothetical protein